MKREKKNTRLLQVERQACLRCLGSTEECGRVLFDKQRKEFLCSQYRRLNTSTLFKLLASTDRSSSALFTVLWTYGVSGFMHHSRDVLELVDQARSLTDDFDQSSSQQGGWKRLLVHSNIVDGNLAPAVDVVVQQRYRADGAWGFSSSHILRKAANVGFCDNDNMKTGRGLYLQSSCCHLHIIISSTPFDSAPVESEPAKLALEQRDIVQGLASSYSHNYMCGLVTALLYCEA